MGAHQERTSEGMEQRIRSEERNSLSRERCNSQASRRVQLELQETGDCRRSTISSDVGEHWVQESCQGGVVQYCSRANTPSKVQHHHQGGKEEQDLYNSMKRSMEKKLRENRQSYQDPSWKKEQEAGTISKEVYPITSPQLMGRQISTKNELLRVYRESIRRGELASLCMKTKKGRETLTLSVMVKSQVAQNPGGDFWNRLEPIQAAGRRGLAVMCLQRRSPTICQCAPRQNRTTAMTKCNLPRVEQILSSTTIIES